MTPEATASPDADPTASPDPELTARPTPTPNRHVAVAGPVSGPAGGGRSGGAQSIGGAILPPPASDGGILALVSGVASQVGQTVKPAVAVAVAATFGFPLLLMIAVLLYLVVQSRLDGRDPKLRAAPLTTAETLIPFREEDHL